MQDIHFNMVDKDVDMSNGDFPITQNPSVQNAGIIQYSRCAFTSTPMLGIGMQDVINAATSKTAYEMNRWQQQVINDGATLAKWSVSTSNNIVNIITNISYE